MRTVNAVRTEACPLNIDRVTIEQRLIDFLCYKSNGDTGFGEETVKIDSYMEECLQVCSLVCSPEAKRQRTQKESHERQSISEKQSRLKKVRKKYKM